MLVRLTARRLRRLGSWRRSELLRGAWSVVPYRFKTRLLRLIRGVPLHIPRRIVPKRNILPLKLSVWHRILHRSVLIWNILRHILLYVLRRRCRRAVLKLLILRRGAVLRRLRLIPLLKIAVALFKKSLRQLIHLPDPFFRHCDAFIAVFHRLFAPLEKIPERTALFKLRINIIKPQKLDGFVNARLFVL